MVSLEYDPSCNALYIRIKTGKVAESEPLSDSLIVDLDPAGEILGIELLADRRDLSRFRKLAIVENPLRHDPIQGCHNRPLR